MKTTKEGTRGCAAGWILAVLLLSPPAARADGFKAIAKELAKAAQRAGLQGVAVLPFEPTDASDRREGWNIAEKLTTQLVRQGHVQAVERNLLGKLMNEEYLGETGAIEQAKIRRVGRILSVDAIVTGSFASAGNETLIDARLIDARTGAILAASERPAPREWFDPLGLIGKLAPMPLDPYAFGGPDGEAPLIPPPAPESVPELIASADLRDALSRGGCVDAAERVDRLEAGILELKARFWAAQLRAGLSMDKIRYNPGSTITDPALKRRFYQRMQAWYSRPAAPALTAMEVARFTDADQKAFQLHQECGL